MATVHEALRRRMLIIHLAILAGLYALGALFSLGQPAAGGEWAAVFLCAIGLVIAVGKRLAGWGYAVALTCVCVAPVTAMVYHDQAVAQVWALIPLMFAAVFVRTWHPPAIARAAAVAISAAAAVALVVAPAEVPGLWLALFAVCILGGAEVFGVLHSTLLDAALRDPLTSAWNRAGLDRQASEVLARARRRGDRVAVIVLDVDEFKTINDRDGHAVGDRTLADLANRWRAILPESAVLARVGGDEFVVVAVGCRDDEAKALATELGGDGPVPVTAGLAVSQPHEVSTFEAMLASADEDLYRLRRRRKRGSPEPGGPAAR